MKIRKNLNHCMSIKQSKYIVNVHKHNLLSSFCNNRYIFYYYDFVLFLLNNMKITENQSKIKGILSY